VKPANKKPHSATIVALPEAADVTDATLVARARAGDRWAKDAIVRRHAAAVAGTVARLVGDLDEAQDLVQETFTAALAELADLRDASALRAWLLQIAVRKVHRRFRLQKLLRVLGLAPGDASGLAELASAEASPEQRVELALLDGALTKLSAAERVAWSLRHVEGMRLDEVASACGCSLATAKRRVAAADALVRKHVELDPEGDA